MITRHADVSDARSIAEVHVRSWQAAYVGQVPDDYLAGLSVAQREAAWGEIIGGSEWPATGTLVLVDDKVLGFASIGPSRDEGADPRTGEVRAIYLDPGAWGRGGGRVLMDEALRSLRAAGFTDCILWVLRSNDRARRFYEKGDWRFDGSERVTDSRGFALTEVRYRCWLERGTP